MSNKKQLSEALGLDPNIEDPIYDDSIPEDAIDSHSGFRNPFYGKHHTEEVRLRMNRTGIKHTDVSKLKMSLKRKGVLKSKEHADKIGAAHVGMKRSEKTKENMRKAYTPERRAKVAESNRTRWL
jgi:hypothetical protein